MKLKNVKGMNFQGYRSFDIKAPDSSFCIVGANMSGKSTFGRAVVWALAGKFAYHSDMGRFLKDWVRPTEKLVLRADMTENERQKAIKSYGLQAKKNRKSKNGQPTIVQLVFSMPHFTLGDDTQKTLQSGIAVQSAFDAQPANEERIYTLTRIETGTKSFLSLEDSSGGYYYTGQTAQEFILSLANIPAHGTQGDRIEAFLRNLWLGVGQSTSFFFSSGTKRREILEQTTPFSKLSAMKEEADRRYKQRLEEYNDTSQQILGEAGRVNEKRRDLAAQSWNFLGNLAPGNLDDFTENEKLLSSITERVKKRIDFLNTLKASRSDVQARKERQEEALVEAHALNKKFEDKVVIEGQLAAYERNLGELGTLDINEVICQIKELRPLQQELSTGIAEIKEGERELGRDRQQRSSLLEKIDAATKVAQRDSVDLVDVEQKTRTLAEFTQCLQEHLNEMSWHVDTPSTLRGIQTRLNNDLPQDNRLLDLFIAKFQSTKEPPADTIRRLCLPSSKLLIKEREHVQSLRDAILTLSKQLSELAAGKERQERQARLHLGIKAALEKLGLCQSAYLTFTKSLPSNPQKSPHPSEVDTAGSEGRSASLDETTLEIENMQSLTYQWRRVAELRSSVEAEFQSLASCGRVPKNLEELSWLCGKYGDTVKQERAELESVQSKGIDIEKNLHQNQKESERLNEQLTSLARPTEHAGDVDAQNEATCSHCGSLVSGEHLKMHRRTIREDLRKLNSTEKKLRMQINENEKRRKVAADRLTESERSQAEVAQKQELLKHLTAQVEQLKEEIPSTELTERRMRRCALDLETLGRESVLESQCLAQEMEQLTESLLTAEVDQRRSSDPISTEDLTVLVEDVILEKSAAVNSIESDILIEQSRQAECSYQLTELLAFALALYGNRDYDCDSFKGALMDCTPARRIGLHGNLFRKIETDRERLLELNGELAAIDKLVQSRAEDLDLKTTTLAILADVDLTMSGVIPEIDQLISTIGDEITMLSSQEEQLRERGTEISSLQRMLSRYVADLDGKDGEDCIKNIASIQTELSEMNRRLTDIKLADGVLLKYSETTRKESLLDVLEARRGKLELEQEGLSICRKLLAPNGDARTLALTGDVGGIIEQTNQNLASLETKKSLAVSLEFEKGDDSKPTIELNFEVDGPSTSGRELPSKSQRHIIGIIMDLAVRSQGGRNGFFFIDEPEEGLDDVNKAKLTHFLKHQSSQVILLTNNASSGFDKTISTEEIGQSAPNLSIKDFGLRAEALIESGVRSVANKITEGRDSGSPVKKRKRDDAVAELETISDDDFDKIDGGEL